MEQAWNGPPQVMGSQIQSIPWPGGSGGWDEDDPTGMKGLCVEGWCWGSLVQPIKGLACR